MNASSAPVERAETADTMCLFQEGEVDTSSVPAGRAGSVKSAASASDKGNRETLWRLSQRGQHTGSAAGDGSPRQYAPGLRALKFCCS